jgi:hypothetical protein
MDQHSPTPPDVSPDHNPDVDPPVDPDAVLARRYGRAAGSDRRGRRPGPWTLGLGGAIVLGGVAFAGYSAWTVAAQPLHWNDFGYRVVDDSAVDVTFDVTFSSRLPQGARAVCTLRALNQRFAEVGLREVTVGPASAGSLRVTERVPTSERAVTGTVRDCVRG